MTLENRNSRIENRTKFIGAFILIGFQFWALNSVFGGTLAETPASASRAITCDWTSPETAPANSDASAEARTLYSYVASQYGKKILSGQQESDASSTEPEFIHELTGKYPAIKGFDLIFYTPSSNWKDNAPARMLDWAIHKGGIVSISWHWFAPSGGTSFYTSGTTFDVSRAVIPGTPENALVLRDIDSIAVPLKQLRDAGVPVLWRPLHEAQGGWFWWGARGPEPLKKLYSLLYERLTQYHRLNHLIWVYSFSVPLSSEWYPGNSMVDIVGADMYDRPGEHNPNTHVFQDLCKISNGRKIIAYTENGPIPDLEKSKGEGFLWSWFNTWGGNFIRDGVQNSAEMIKKIYSHPGVLTLEDLPPLVSKTQTPSVPTKSFY